MTRCITRNFAPREDFPSPLSFRVFLTWVAVQQHLFLACTLMLSQPICEWRLAIFLFCQLLGHPHAAIVASWDSWEHQHNNENLGHQLVQLLSSDPPAYAQYCICHFSLMMDCCCGPPKSWYADLKEPNLDDLWLQLLDVWWSDVPSQSRPISLKDLLFKWCIVLYYRWYDLLAPESWESMLSSFGITINCTWHPFPSQIPLIPQGLLSVMAGLLATAA